MIPFANLEQVISLIAEADYPVAVSFGCDDLATLPDLLRCLAALLEKNPQGDPLCVAGRLVNADDPSHEVYYLVTSTFVGGGEKMQ